MGVDFYEVYIDLEQDFDIRFLNDVMSVPAEYVGELFDVLIKALREQHPERFAVDSHYEELVWEQYKGYFVNQLDVRPEHFVRTAHFVHDLKFY
jgi:hypothetical protein